MQILPHYNKNKINSNSQIKNREINFNGLMWLDPKTYAPLDSWFFRDYTTLKTATDEIKNSFPQGAEILDYACSNGEETISLKALLPDTKYKITGFDTSESALKLANRGVYTVFSHWYDSFLLPNTYPKSKEAHLKNSFYNIMEETFPAPQDRLINNKKAYFDIKKSIPEFLEKFFCINSEHKNSIDIRRGNISNLDKYRTSNPIGAVFFRNALYQMIGNDLNESIEQRKTTEFIYNKKDIINNFVDKLYSKLDKGGVFVIGDHIKDHLFLADKNTPDDEIIFFKDTPFFNPENKFHRQASYLRLFKESPLRIALEKDKKFKAVGFSKTWLDIGGTKVKVPTVWKILK